MSAQENQVILSRSDVDAGRVRPCRISVCGWAQSAAHAGHRFGCLAFNRAGASSQDVRCLVDVQVAVVTQYEHGALARWRGGLLARVTSGSTAVVSSSHVGQDWRALDWLGRDGSPVSGHRARTALDDARNAREERRQRGRAISS
jgi:hypothetical protein